MVLRSGSLRVAKVHHDKRGREAVGKAVGVLHAFSTPGPETALPVEKALL